MTPESTLLMIHNLERDKVSDSNNRHLVLLGSCSLFDLKTYAAISNAHLSHVCKRGKLSGSCLSTLNGFGSTQLPIFLCHIGVPTFSSQNNSLKCV